MQHRISNKVKRVVCKEGASKFHMETSQGQEVNTC